MQGILPAADGVQYQDNFVTSPTLTQSRYIKSYSGVILYL
jgi:hypothetical protein